MRLPHARSKQMDDAVPARRQQLGDEAAMAPPPHRLGAHEAWGRLRERGPQCLLPGGLAHPRRIAPEGRRSDAREALLARLATPATAKLDLMAVGDPGVRQRLRESVLSKLGIPPRLREPPDVHERLDVRLAQASDELLARSRTVANREERHRGSL